MAEIEGFSSYYYDFDTKKIYKKCDNSEIKIYYKKNNTEPNCRMKNDNGIIKRISYNTIKALAGDKISTDGFFILPYSNGKTWINKEGYVISFSSVPCGKYLTSYLDTHGYPSVTCFFKGKFRKMGIHSLLAYTFIDKEYTDKGLCVLHLDNNPLNHSLSNLKVGTYSENNQQAFNDNRHPDPKCIKRIHNKANQEIKKEDLEKLIYTMPFTEIGKIYGISANSIKKWCVKFNLPSRKIDIRNILKLTNKGGLAE